MCVRNSSFRFCIVVATGIFLFYILISPNMSGVIRLSKIDLKLVQAQIFFRHGARTPLHYVKSPLRDAKWTTEYLKDDPETVIPTKHIDIFDGTPVDESTYDLTYRPIKLPGGAAIGMLTELGQKDLYRFGVRLRKTYAGIGRILSDPPKIAEIEARSTRVGRNLKSLRSLVAGLSNGQVDDPLVITSMEFGEEVLFPNPNTFVHKIFEEGTEELLNDAEICSLKEKIKKALQVDHLVDELENDEKKYTRDCQIYYVRDDYVAREHNGFPIPEGLNDLHHEINHYSAVELLNELLGKRENWLSNLDITIGPVVHVILSKIHQYANIPPLQLFAVHDSTILPMLLALNCCDEMWPPFGADIIFELYVQTLGPSYSRAFHVEELVYCPDAVRSHIDWSAIRVDQLWIRITYLGRPIPLATIWSNADDEVRRLTGSDEYLPLQEFLRRLTPLSVSLEDHRARSEKNQIGNAAAGEEDGSRLGPKNLLLNKVTPDTFISSSKGILAIHVESPSILDIFVQLIFQKAANEPNFTYLYSQLCVVLCERARNFEPENVTSTFKLLLLKRCENEFFKRESIDITDSIARQRWIGAVRFIAFLGCDKAIPDKILHDCVRALLLCKQTGNSNKTTVPSQTQEGTHFTPAYPKENGHVALDMECLCKFLRIAGSYMDTPKARNLMNQYFDRLSQILERASPEHLRQSGGKGKFIPLSTRIRFMIRDIIDLRKNKWRPLFDGQFADHNQPWLLSALRREIDRPSKGNSNLGSSPGNFGGRSVLGHFPDSLEPEGDWNTLNQMGKALCSRNKDIDLFSSTESSTSMGATVHRNRDSGYSSGGGGANTPHNRTTTSGGVGSGNGSNDGSSGGSNGSCGGWTGRSVAERRSYRPQRSPNLREFYTQGPKAPVVGSSSASFFEPEYLQSTQKISELQRASSVASSGDATGNLNLDGITAGRSDVRQLGGSLWRPSVMRPSPPPSRQQFARPAVITYLEKQAPVDENKEAAKAMIGILANSKNIQEAVDQLTKKNLISRLNKEVLLKSMLLLCDGASTSYPTTRRSKCTACQFASLMQYFHSQPQSDPIPPSLDSVWPRVLQCLSAASPKDALAFLTARLVLTGRLSLSRVAETLSAGRHHPLFLTILQQLAQMATSGASPGGFVMSETEAMEEKDIRDEDDGNLIPEGVTFPENLEGRRAQLVQMFAQSGVVLAKILPEECQSPKRMLELLQERSIDFFLPCLSLVVETLCPLLVHSDDLNVFASYLPKLENHLSAEVVHSLMGAAFERVSRAGSGLTSADEEELEEVEAAVWRTMTLEGQLDKCVPFERQMNVLHALQVFWNDKGKPKGFVLRCFQNLYEFDLVEKTTFMVWREEVDPTYPAKGQALFEVMRWLNWLETVEEVEDSEDGEEDNNDNDGENESGGEDVVTSENVKMAVDVEATSVDHVNVGDDHVDTADAVDA